ncbi:MAG: carboxypeptidase-like regulatory domain-containing protein [Acidobacteriota bacterium]
MKYTLRLCISMLCFVLPATSLALQTDTGIPPETAGLTKQSRSITLHGRVVDARSGEPIAKVKIIVVATQQSTSTDENGGFTLEGIQPGELDLYITTVTYGLVKKTITVKDVERAEVEIALNQEGATLTEKITVSAGPFEQIETNAPSEKALNKTELQTLSMVLVGDPLRASQSLPGVTANNDLRSEFAVRGAGYDHIGIYVDGILTDDLVHTTIIDNETDNKLSLSVINSDTLSGLSFFSGSFPAKYGEKTAAVLNLETRDGNRIKPSGRFSTGVLTTAGVVDGPFANKKGSWLIAGRTSYVDYLQRFVEKITNTNAANTDNESNGSLDFTDMQSKVVYDLSSRHQVGISAIYGLFLGADPASADRTDPNDLHKLDSRNLLVNAHWNYSPNAQLLAQTRVFALQTNSTTVNRNDAPIDDRNRTQIGVRNDTNFLTHRAHRIEGGFYVRSIGSSQTSNFFRISEPTVFDALESFDRKAVEQAYYGQDTWSSERNGLSITGGGRIQHSGLTGETLFSPRASLAISRRNTWTLRAGFGKYYQFPDFRQLFGYLGNPNLRAERATHYNMSVERTFGDRTRVLAEVYDREDKDQIFSLSEPRVQAGNITLEGFPFQNSLRGHARGVELSVQRRSANGLTGWISYAYSRTQLQDMQDSLSFVSDFDQRHTINTYGSYRLTATFNLSAQWRYGSGLPWRGFLEPFGSGFTVGSQRNTARLPYYSRVDLRANKAFLFRKWKLTLSGEVLNVQNRMNFVDVRSDPIRIKSRGRAFYGLTDLMPILPSIGVAFDF